MRVISLKLLKEFWDRHPDAQAALRAWYATALSAQWASLQDVRRTLRSADGVRTGNDEILTVFNICGNKYRLIVRIRYEYWLVNVRAVLTHPEYDRGNWRE